MNRSREPVRRWPFITRIDETTPAVLVEVRIEDEGLERLVGCTDGGRDAIDTASSSSGTPSPVLAEIRRISSAAMPSTDSISAA